MSSVCTTTISRSTIRGYLGNNMSLYEKIRKDYNATRVSRDEIRINLLSTLIGDLQGSANVENGHKVVKDVTVISKIKSYIKNAEIIIKSINDVAKGNHSDAEVEGIKRANLEIQVLNSYLPTQLDKNDLIILFHQTAPNVKLSDWMSFLKKNHAGTYDGKLATEVWKEWSEPSE